MIENDISISLVDAENLSVFVPIYGCEKKCPFCFNNETLNVEKMDEQDLFDECLRLSDDVKVFVFGGNNPVGINYPIVKKVSDKLKEKGCKIYIQVSRISRFDYLNIIELRPDKIFFTINDMIQSDYDYLAERLQPENRIVYIPGKTHYPRNIVGTLTIQQFQSGNCLDPEYNKISQPARKQVLEFARKLDADYIITKERGREKV